ncbi:MAG: carbon monoxide dehydrogenase, partial [Deltaproteobacteria bacterium]
SGIFTVLGTTPPILGSMNVVKMATEGLNDVIGATLAVEPDPEKAAILIRRHIEKKRAGLGLPSIEV